MIAVALAVAFVGGAGPDPVTMGLTSLTTVTPSHDTTPKGKANKGDTIEFNDLLVKAPNNELGKAKGKAVGYDEGKVLYTSATARRSRHHDVSGCRHTQVRERWHARTAPCTCPSRAGPGLKGAKVTRIVGVGDEKAPNTYRLSLPHVPCSGGCD